MIDLPELKRLRGENRNLISLSRLEVSGGGVSTE